MGFEILMIHIIFKKSQSSEKIMSKLVYQSRRKNCAFLDRLMRFISEKYIIKKSRFYLEQYPQVATFAFDYIGYQILLDGRYENDELEVLVNALSQHAPTNYFDGTVLDVGANIGNHSIFFSSLFGRVLSFEPNPRTFELLKINTRVADNISSFGIGLSNCARQGAICFSRGNLGGGGTSVNIDEGNAALSFVEVSFSTVDKVINDLSQIPVSLIKIDTEGHEFEVVSGAQETIRRDQPVVVFEQHISDFSGVTTKTIELLRSCGYSKFGYISKDVYPFFGELKIENIFIKFVLKALFGQRSSMLVTDKVRPAFYSFLVAFPKGFLLNNPNAD